MSHSNRPDGLALYSAVAQQCSHRVIRRYSTSFTAAALMLPRGTRRHIANIYGLVRIADEIVDGSAAEAGLDPADRLAVLDALEEETRYALAHGYSTNVVVHAFAVTARTAGIGADLTTPFFRSMRRDLAPVDFATAEELDDYVYGSAEVVGLMCLAVFLLGHAPGPERLEILRSGARRLGAAFQKVNFLRDLATDWLRLGRRYFPHVDPEALTEDDKSAILNDIDNDLRSAHDAIRLLPRGSRAGVLAAHGLFRALSARLRETPAPDLIRTRAHVPTVRKVSIVAKAWLPGTAGAKQ